MTGTIATFYSYKGGVGRSFLLANAATLLVRWGYRVLCIDWDIEAPGLDEYFRPWLGGQSRPGLVEWVAAFGADKPVDWRDHVSHVKLPGAAHSLDVMTAAAEGPGLASRVQAIDWRDLYDRRGFGSYLENVRDEWKQEYDLVLIDSRTGITDIGGICTVHLPDILVVVFTANQQSLKGVRDIVQMAELQRSKLPLSRAGLLTLPVPARFDARGQDDLAKEWLSRIATELDSLYDSWLDADLSPRQFLDVSRIPYLSAWTFGERLAALEERENDPECITYHFATIAALVARRMEDASQLIRGRDLYVDVARVRGRERSQQASSDAFPFEYYVSYPRELVQQARDLTTGLRAVGKSVFLDSDEIRAGTEIRGAIENAAAQCRHFVALRSSPKSSPWQRLELETFIEAAHEDPSRSMFDVQLASSIGDLAYQTFEYPVATDRLHRIDASSPKFSSDDIVAKLLPDAHVLAEAPIDDHLRVQAALYMEIQISDYVQRVMAKDVLSAEMGVYVREHRISRDELARANHDGFAVALAEAVNAAAQPGDLDRLLLVGPKVRRLHAMFRILTAISAVVERERVSDQQREVIQKRILDLYDDMARGRSDEPLAALVATTRRRLKNLT